MQGLTGRHVRIVSAAEDRKLLAFHRFAVGGAGDDVIVVANLSSVQLDGVMVGVPRRGEWHRRFHSGGYFVGDSDDEVAAADALVPRVVTTVDVCAKDVLYGLVCDVAPYSVVVFSQNPRVAAA